MWKISLTILFGCKPLRGARETMVMICKLYIRNYTLTQLEEVRFRIQLYKIRSLLQVTVSAKKNSNDLPFQNLIKTSIFRRFENIF